MSQVPVDFVVHIEGNPDDHIDRIYVSQDDAKRLPASRLFERARQAGKLQGYQHDGKVRRLYVADVPTGDVDCVTIYLLKYDPADSGFVEPK